MEATITTTTTMLALEGSEDRITRAVARRLVNSLLKAIVDMGTIANSVTTQVAVGATLATAFPIHLAAGLVDRPLLFK